MISSTVRGLFFLGFIALYTEPALAAGNKLTEYTWLLVVAAIMAFFCAYGIGANDVANSFATSVGAKSLTIKQAVVLAVIFEFTGAVALGGSVSETVRKGIADPACFVDNPGLLMWGMTCVIISTGVWLILASMYEMPVSTTHSCIGGIIGMTMMSRDSNCVIWYEEVEEFPFVEGVTAVVVSWVLSPVLSGVISALFYAMTYATVLRWGDKAFLHTKIAFPFIVGFTVCVNVIMTIIKGAKGRAEDLHTDDQVNEAKEGNIAPVGVTGLIGGAIAAFLVACATPWLSKFAEEKAAIAEQEEAAAKERDIETSKGTELAPASPALDEDGNAITKYVSEQLNADPHAVLQQDAKINSIHENYQRHDRRSEEMFKFVQVFTAMVAAFSHGANDVANAMGPFAAIYMTWKDGAVSVDKEEVGDDMYWILTLGGAGISLGLATYGYKIMSLIGVKMTAITPSRGYCIELAAAFVVIFGTTQGWPLSTTHCQVGATVGVGLFEGKNGIHLPILAKIVFGWLITLIVVGLSAAILVGPSPEPIKDMYCA